jgi:hypothetical protein
VHGACGSLRPSAAHDETTTTTKTLVGHFDGSLPALAALFGVTLSSLSTAPAARRAFGPERDDDTTKPL